MSETSNASAGTDSSGEGASGAESSGEDRSAAASSNGESHLLELDDISKYYGNIIALRGVSTFVNAGEVTCVLGDNGAGKSTLIKILAGVHKQTEGTIRVVSTSPTWSGAPGEPATEQGRNALPGSPEWARNVIWSTLSGLSEIELTVETQLRTTPQGQAALSQLTLEPEQIVVLCQEPISVVELAGRLAGRHEAARDRVEAPGMLL